MTFRLVLAAAVALSAAPVLASPQLDAAWTVSQDSVVERAREASTRRLLQRRGIWILERRGR